MLSTLGALVRRHDPDRFFCALFAPEAKREMLFTLYAFNHELARSGEVATEPGLALIRLQWWREVVEGAVRRHEVAAPLRAAIAAGALPHNALLDMVAARETAVEGVATVDSWRDMQMVGPGSLSVASGFVLGVDVAAWPRLRGLGAAYGVAGTIRNALAGRGPGGLPADIATLARTGLVLAGAPAPIPPHAAAAALPAVLARCDLRRLPRYVAARGLSDRLAVIWGAARGLA
jgi:phytoene synthase